MGNQLNTRRKVILFTIAALVWVRFRKVYYSYRHAWKVLRKLPAPDRSSNRNMWVLNGALASELSPSGGAPTLTEIRQNAAGAFGRFIEKTPEAEKVGIINLQFLNETVDNLLPFNTLSMPIIFGNEKIREFLSAKAMEKLEKGQSYEVAHSLIGDSVLSTSGDVWHSQRQVLNKGFTDELMSVAIPKICKTVEELSHRWEHNFLSKPVAVHEEMLKLTMDVLGRAALSHDFNRYEGSRSFVY